MMVRSDNKLTLYVAQILRLMLMVCLLTSHDITVVTWITRCGNKTTSQQVALGEVCAALCK